VTTAEAGVREFQRQCGEEIYGFGGEAAFGPIKETASVRLKEIMVELATYGGIMIAEAKPTYVLIKRLQNLSRIRPIADTVAQTDNAVGVLCRNIG